MLLDLQAKLLRALEERAVMAVGGSVEHSVDVRVLSAAHTDLPSDLHADLSAAIAVHDITQLRQHLDALAELNAEGQSLAAHLHELARKYDIVGIKTALEKIQCE